MGNRRESLLIKYTYPVGFLLTGVGYCMIRNFRRRKPMFSGIQRHVFWGSVGLAFGLWVDGIVEDTYAERDAMLKHYMELHPEDFTEKKRKYKEILEEWYPVR